MTTITIKNSEKGTGLFTVIVAIAVVAIIGLVAYRVRVINHYSQSSTTANIPSVIKTKADLKQAHTALKSLPITSDLNTDQLEKSVGTLQ